MFAYGMVLFELVSLSSPFENIQPPLKRNHEVKDGRRPNLDVKETRSPLLLQELMFICWEQEPDNRPRMEQVVEWIQAPEFERLRAEVLLKEIKSISCACVCRIRPEYESAVAAENFDSFREHTQPVYNGIIDFERLQSEDLDRIGNMDSLIEEYGSVDGSSGGIDLIVQNMLASTSIENVCIEDSKGKKISNSDEDIYQFVPSKHTGGMHGMYRDTSRRKKKRFAGTRMRSKSDSTKKEAVASVANFDPYTQIWMCGRDQRKGLLQIFTFNDCHSGYYVSAVCGLLLADPFCHSPSMTTHHPE